MVKILPAMQETQVWSLGWEDPLEKGMATHSSILAWRIPWIEKPGRLQSTESQRVRHNWLNHYHHLRSSWHLTKKPKRTFWPTPYLSPRKHGGLDRWKAFVNLWVWSRLNSPRWWPRKNKEGYRWEGGSGWGTHVHPRLIQVNVWQNHHNTVK